MNNLNLQTNYLDIQHFFNLKLTNNKPDIFINKSLYKYLLVIQEQIQQYSNWNKMKPYIHVHELLYNDNQTYRFYIYIELFNQYKLKNISYTLHISNNTLESLNALLMFENNPINIHDITNMNEIMNPKPITHKYNLICCDIINDENELSYSKFMLIQILYALTVQNKKGTFILKIYDIFYSSTIDMIYLLSCCYENITVYKPSIVDVISSEKYIICEKFKYDDFDNKIYEGCCSSIDNDMYIERIFTFDIGYYFIDRLIEINSILGQSQIESIKNIIHLLLSENICKLESIKLYNVKKCKEWCEKHNIITS